MGCVFLLQAQYLIILCTFKDQLQQHVRVHAVEAVMACREIETTLQALTGLSSPPLNMSALDISFSLVNYGVVQS